MLVAVTGFGSVWRERLPGIQHKAGPIFYNTTGITVQGAVRQRPKIVGYARFHTHDGFDPNLPHRTLGRVFECDPPCVWMGTNKLNFKRTVARTTVPDRYLLVARTELVGRMPVGSSGWRSDDTWILSLSEDGDQQEALLLMGRDGWMRTSLGTFVVGHSTNRPKRWLLTMTPKSSLTMQTIPEPPNYAEVP